MSPREVKQPIQKKENLSQISFVKVPFTSRIKNLFLYVKKYGWDLAGILLILFAAITLFGMLEVSKGVITYAWAGLVKKAFGWGGYGLVFLLAGLGIVAILFKAGKAFPLRFGQFIAIETAFFTLLPLLTSISRSTLMEAEIGRGGGTIGWGLAHFIPGWFGFIIYFLLFCFSLLIATGIFGRFLKSALSWSSMDSST